MFILFLTNNIDTTHQLFEWLQRTEGEVNVDLYSGEIKAQQFSAGKQFAHINFVISYNYVHIIPEDVITLFPHKILNLHTSMLPWNRGASPNIWSFLEGTPTGVTIHEVNSGIDTGDILLQREIIYDYKSETLKSSYEKSHKIISDLFCDHWDKLKNGLIKPKPQVGTRHFKKDSLPFDSIIDYNDTIDEFIRKYSELAIEVQKK